MDLTQATQRLAQRVPQMVNTNRKQFDVNAFSNLNSFGTVNSTPQFGSTDLKNLGTLTTDYGGSTKYEKFHPGVDVANKIGTNIPAFTGGKVTQVTSGYKQGDKGYGNSVVVVDDQGNKHRYSHLYKAWVKVGQTIKPGQVLGAMGNTGSTYSTSGGTGSHLDYRVVDAYNKYVNPYKFIRKTV